jgi:N-methylhydantoinase B
VYREGRLIEELPSKYSGYKMQAGDVIEFHTACGGGYGAPHERDPAQVLADVLDGFLDEEEAAVVYGVRIRAEAIDKEETARLRSELATRST